MSTTVCPNGHMSADPEWCDTCGARLSADPDPLLVASSPNAAAPPDPTVVSTAPGAPSAPCPHCGAANVPDALFCEDCGYDFTTGQAPDPVPTGTVPAVGSAQFTASSAAGSSSAASSMPGTSPGLASSDAGAIGRWPPGWIVIVEVDPVWFELKGTLADRPCPPPSSSTISLGAAIVHIGRSSQSRGIHPEIAMDSDTAVSRQHAQLIATSTATGSHVSPTSVGGVAGAGPGGAGGAGAADVGGAGAAGAGVGGAGVGGADEAAPDAYAAVDLSSTNGTFVVPAGAEPDASIEPIAPGVPVPLADGDRVYIGAWSRLTIRHTGV